MIGSGDNAAMPGAERAGSLEEHEARTALRRLVAGVFDAWDVGDAALVAAHFVADGLLADPFTARSEGRAAIEAHLIRWWAWEPWSIHWVANEKIEPTASGMAGTWLWFALSDIDSGSTSAWSGGDLVVSAVCTSDGWRIAELAFGDRYRTPRADGWLTTPFVVPTAGTRSSPPRATPSLTVPAIEALPDGTEAHRLAALRDEAAIRGEMARFVLDLERAAPPEECAARWCTDGELHLVGADGTIASATGRDKVGALLAIDAADASAWIRVLTSEWISVRGRITRARWRDLWTAERGGEARWFAHAYDVDLRRERDIWHIAGMRRTRLLDEPYGGGR